MKKSIFVNFYDLLFEIKSKVMSLIILARKQIQGKTVP